MTLTDFLLARIAEDEAAIERRHDVECEHLYEVVAADGYYRECGCGVPARVLAECQAKRAILDRVRSMTLPIPGDMRRGEEIAYTLTLRHLAAVYADHPDYREEWRP